MSNFVDDFCMKLDAFESKICFLDTVSALEQRICDTEGRSRQQNIEISGVPESNKENLIDIVKQIGNYINYNINDDHIITVHRVQQFAHNAASSSNTEHSNKKPKNIILKFT